MRGHLTSKHQIEIEEKNAYNDIEEYEDFIPNEPQDIVKEDLKDPPEKINHKGKSNDSKYDKHFVINHITNQAACRICHKTITKNCYGMRGHLRYKHQIVIKDKIPKSKEAKYSFKYDDYYDINPTTKEAVCKTCKKTVSENLIWHLRDHKKPKGIKGFKCTQCGKNYADKIILSRHIASVHEHEKNHMCSKCGMKFSCSQTLKKHSQVVHDGIKKFKCEKCSREFGQKIDLKRHIEGGE